jgi:hypothetical protein
MNNELMQQCREEAEEAAKAAYNNSGNTMSDYKKQQCFINGWMAHAERSKPQPKCLTVDVAMEVVEVWDRETMYEPDRILASKLLRERLTKAAE